jgi:hypothetical protein
MKGGCQKTNLDKQLVIWQQWGGGVKMADKTRGVKELGEVDWAINYSSKVRC